MDELLPQLLTFPPVPVPAKPPSDSEYDQSISLIVKLLEETPRDVLAVGLSSGENILDVRTLHERSFPPEQQSNIKSRFSIHQDSLLHISSCYGLKSNRPDSRARLRPELSLMRRFSVGTSGHGSPHFWKSSTPYRFDISECIFESY